ncbi:hypothetical protein B0H17DRAFT_1047799 [Mycena rosella]|uniref:Transmembrane protein n=1 Tax=Mycena rosella TaxID=1033263 RepID=A0AAD7DU98_MYCRO|nr:hypothetical protein B0H17DRAFT_1047799 [Mycena rosella]
MCSSSLDLGRANIRLFLCSPSSSVLSTSTSSATSISVAPSSASAASTPPPDLSTGTGLSTGADGAVQTVSRVFTVTTDPSQTAAPAVRTKSFLENKPVSGTIFAFIAILGLVLIFGIARFAMRRRRRRRLLDDAVSFDPGLLAAATERYDGSEKGYSSAASVRTMGSGPASGYPSSYYGATQNQNPSSYYGATQNPSPYYGANQNPTAQQPYYSAYVPPMADTSAPSSLAGTRAPPHTIPRVPVPQQPLPAEFGSSDSRLKVVNE